MQGGASCIRVLYEDIVISVLSTDVNVYCWSKTPSTHSSPKGTCAHLLFIGASGTSLQPALVTVTASQARIHGTLHDQ
jgi:hypothetical protein